MTSPFNALRGGCGRCCSWRDLAPASPSGTTRGWIDRQRHGRAVWRHAPAVLDLCELQSPNIDPPEVKGLEFRMGPSTSNSTSWVNGVTTSEQRYTYNYKVVGSGRFPFLPRFGRPAKAAEKQPRPVVCFRPCPIPDNEQQQRQHKRQPARDLVTGLNPASAPYTSGSRLC